MTLTTTSSDGTSIAYEVAGDGPTLVLVGGATSYRALDPTGAALVELLPHLTVVRYDRRGRGESGDSKTYAVAREIEDLDAIIAAVGGSAAVLGESSGAVLALEVLAPIVAAFLREERERESPPGGVMFGFT